MPDDNPFLAFTDDDLSALLLRAVRLIAILAIAGAVIFLIISGWQSALLFLVGAGISGFGVYESRRLIRVINAKLDKQRSPQSTGFVIVMFLLRLMIAGAALYVSLRCLHGSVYAVVAGIALAVVALSVEAVKLAQS